MQHVPEREGINLSRWWIAPVLFGVGLGVAATVMRSSGGGDSTGSAGRRAVPATLAAESTAPDAVFETVAPDPTAAGLDPDFLDDVLADDAVGADELDAAYRAYIDCLVVNGGEGYYAFDIELRSGLSIEWQLADADGNVVGDTVGVEAACSATFLGDLQHRFDIANPPDPDLGARQRAAVVACIEPFSSEAAAAFPPEIAVDIAGDISSDAPTLDELHTAPDLFEVAPALRDPITRCIAAAGAPWHAF